MSAIKKLLFGTNTSRKLKKYLAIQKKVNDLESQYQSFSQADIQQKIQNCRDRFANGEALDDLLPEVFCCVRIAADRVLKQRHFDVQIIGGIALNDGQITEMKTGEGKTLTATLPLSLNAVTGKGAHLVTVNDYLAKRDKEWMEPVYNYLGLSVGLIQHGMNDAERREAYGNDITYGTNSEFGFDFLRDNMKYSVENLVISRDYHFVIVDEADSILIDEARTPLIISGSTDESTDKYKVINHALGGLSRGYRVSDNPDPEKVAHEQNLPVEKIGDYLDGRKESDLVIAGDYVLDEKSRNIQLTEQGSQKVEKKLSNVLRSDNIYDIENIDILHHVNQGMKARYVFKNEIDYVVKDNKVIIVDEFTGRLMDGRRYSDGLHQALEAKENLNIEKENRTLATVTYQNFFRKYEKLSGMTGTAETEEEEFLKIYRTGVFVVPTNKPVIRIDHPDAIYKTAKAKDSAIIEKIATLYEKGQPVLVGTDSIENSEHLSTLLKKKQVPHNVLNAKYFEREAEIVANAGTPKSVTIATNMAGRGTDIKVPEESRKLGGLFILGTVRHESRRIDNQLRGRSGRQGDPGESKYFISLEDDLLRIFGGDRIARVMTTLKIDENEAIEHPLISRAIENSQKTVESRNFSIRKHLLEYDDIINRQREIIYSKRKKVLYDSEVAIIEELSENILHSLIEKFFQSKNADEWLVHEFKQSLSDIFLIDLSDKITPEEGKSGIYKTAMQHILAKYADKKNEFAEQNALIEKFIYLDTIDKHWNEHLVNLDYLKESVGLSGYAQKNPMDEYKKEAFFMFTELIGSIDSQAVSFYFKSRLKKEDSHFEPQQKAATMHYNNSAQPARQEKRKPMTKRNDIGRNDPCYCGSGKKYKTCCINKQNH